MVIHRQEYQQPSSQNIINVDRIVDYLIVVSIISDVMGGNHDLEMDSTKKKPIQRLTFFDEDL